MCPQHQLNASVMLADILCDGEKIGKLQVNNSRIMKSTQSFSSDTL